MYRIITSTTKEEHFESPNAAAYGMMMYCANTMPNGQSTTNTLSSMEANIKIIARPPRRLPINKPEISYDYYYGDYDVYGDLYVHGNVYARNYEETVSSEVSKITILSMDPTSNTWQGNIGEMACTSNYAYMCVASDSWVRWKIDSRW